MVPQAKFLQLTSVFPTAAVECRGKIIKMRYSKTIFRIKGAIILELILADSVINSLKTFENEELIRINRALDKIEKSESVFDILRSKDVVRLLQFDNLYVVRASNILRIILRIEGDIVLVVDVTKKDRIDRIRRMFKGIE